MKVCIYTEGFNSACGGATARYKLASILRGMGVDCRVWELQRMGDHYKIPAVGKSWIDADTWVIYPETVIGNPLEASPVRIVRWLLNGVGVLGGDKSSWAPEEIVVSYLPRFRSDPAEELLTVFESWPEFNHPGSTRAPRRGTCYVVHKGHAKPQVAETANAELVIRDPRAAAEMFRRCERFISYDSVTWLSIQAAMCGCLSIVVQDPGVTAEEWRAANMFMRYGVAYGFGDAEIALARATGHMVRAYLGELQQTGMQQVARLLERMKSQERLLW